MINIHDNPVYELPRQRPYVDFSHDTFKVWQGGRFRTTGCREVFQSYYLMYNASREFYYRMPYHVTDEETQKWNIARWFSYIEGRMGWHERTHINRTTAGNIIRIWPSGGWLKNSMSKSLLTLMIRCGNYCYEHSQLEEVLHRNYYTVRTLPAIHRFLQNHHNYLGYNRHWYTTFYGRSWDQVCWMLF